MADVVADGKIVTLHYVLTDAEGEEIDRGGAEDPLQYLHGHGNIVPGLEQALAGKSKGDKVKAVIPPGEGYGEPTGQVEPAPKKSCDATYAPPGRIAIDGEPIYCRVDAG